jgi:enoyl-CoA hydratase/carnithine racemase
MINEHVLSVVQRHVATLTLNRPDKANTLSEAMMDALEERLHEANSNDDVRVIVIAASGKIFCAGHDLAEMRSQEDRAYFDRLFKRCSRLMLSVRESRKPVIAKVQGAAVAAGCQLVATCDLAYAAEHAKFGVNGVNLGLFCSTPSVALSRAVHPRQALELLLTGKLIAAPRAVELGLVNACVPADALDAIVHETVNAIAAKLPEVITLGKDMFWKQLAVEQDAAYQIAGNCMAKNMDFPETRSLIDSFLRKSTR